MELEEFVMAQFLHFLGHSKKLQLHFLNYVLSRYIQSNIPTNKWKTVLAAVMFFGERKISQNRKKIGRLHFRSYTGKIATYILNISFW